MKVFPGDFRFSVAICFCFCCSALVKKYNQVMQRYYVQYLSGYDAVVLNQLIQVISR